MSGPNESLEMQARDGNTEATLTSLAYINVTWENSRTSYFDNFVPFALEVLRTSNHPIIEREIGRGIRERFGLDFPAGVVASLVGRAVRRHQAVRVGSGRVQLAVGIAEVLPDLGAQQADCRRRQNYLVAGLVKFAAERFELVWNETDAEAALVEYIEAHAAPLLAHALSGRQFADGDGETKGRAYVVAAYIGLISETNPAAFEYLEQMIKGSMLAAALYVEAPGDIRRRFRKTTLFLDTSICLRALGHEGPEAKAAAQQMLGLAAAQGADLACFEHSVREMRGILEGARNHMRMTPGAETAIRGVAAYFRDAGYTPSDADLAIQRLERDLVVNRIDIVATPSYSEALGLDEGSLEDRLQEGVGYKNDGARLSDLKSLTAIHRLRGGESGPYLESCVAVLVTNNASLVRVARGFFNSGRHEWPIAMLDHDLAVLVWVKEPATAPDLPRRQVIADCYSALSPSAAMWAKVVDEIERLGRRGDVRPEDVTLLRYSHEAERSMLDLTFGDPRRVSDATIMKALGRAREALLAPVEKTREAAFQRAADAEATQAAQVIEIAEHDDENTRLRRRLEDLEARDTEREVTIRRRVDDRTQLLDRLVSGVLLLILVGIVLSGAVSLFPGMSKHLPGALGWLLRGFALVGVFVSGLILHYGRSLTEWKSIRLGSIRKNWEDRALQRAGLVPEDSGK